jgi:hypothetical protein
MADQLPNSNTQGELDTDAVIEILGEEDESKEEVLDLEKPKKETKEEDEEEKEGKEGEEEEVDELKEIEDELKEPTEEDLELMTPVRRREILNKYPTLFKDFPYLEKAYYREQQFTEIFPTIPDAREAQEKAKVMDGFEEQIMKGGNIGIVLDAIKEENPETFNTVIDNLLPALHKADERAYFHVVGNIIKSTIVSMVQEARNLGEEQGSPLQAAANILNQYIFGTNKFTGPQPLAKPKDTEKLTQEEQSAKKQQEILNQQFESVREDLQTRTDNVLRATIEGNIDPKKAMTDYVRKNATREAFDTLETLIGKDTRFRTLLNKLWEKAFEENFTKQSQERIRAAYLSKAKTLLPTVIKKARNEALKGMGKRTVDEESTPRRGVITPGRSTTPSSGKKEVPKGMKSIDFLMQD